MTELTGKVGFASPISEKVSSRKNTLGVELIATLTLAICLIIAATAVSIGMARAQSHTRTARRQLLRARFSGALQPAA